MLAVISAKFIYKVKIENLHINGQLILKYLCVYLIYRGPQKIMDLGNIYINCDTICENPAKVIFQLSFVLYVIYLANNHHKHNFTQKVVMFKKNCLCIVAYAE